MLICVATPLAGVVYHLFDSSVRIQGWYYSNLFWLFYVIGPHLQMLLTLTGIFLVLPENTKVTTGRETVVTKNYRAYFLLIPVGYHIAKILWYSLWVSSDEDIRQMMPGTFLILLPITGFVWLKTADYLINLHFHKRAGHIARARGILTLTDIDSEQQVRMALRELNAYEQLK